MCTSHKIGDILSSTALHENNESRSENPSNSDNKFAIMASSIHEFLDYIYSLFARLDSEIFKLVFQAENYNDVGDLYAALILTIIWLAVFTLNNSDWFHEVVCFFRDLCIEAMHTFANVFQGIVNVIGSITCDDVEDFASACIVVLLWIGAVKIIFSIFNKQPRAKRGLGAYKRSRNHLTLY
ncbi:uncharacterized protein LOC117171936 isoform X2 [Belonocnema kinseyi]|uniref:uncharacterized protein LOC117171936 isoform X2 n=1 Tax=Belonocnema kinseyi TaxID=2817044 RepID=UPI00143DAA67|nr:uncharacterized protein LOC117171936 isoform X2 [Belonocnema kinseyi]